MLIANESHDYKKSILSLYGLSKVSVDDYGIDSGYRPILYSNLIIENPKYGTGMVCITRFTDTSIVLARHLACCLMSIKRPVFLLLLLVNKNVPI